MEDSGRDREDFEWDRSEGGGENRHKGVVAIELADMFDVLRRHAWHVVRKEITDRGPFVKGREIDLSKKAFQAISYGKGGFVIAKLEVLQN